MTSSHTINAISLPGGGLWSVAARMAGWSDERPLWTGSCPCQPFSIAGKGKGFDDPRHLWPDFFRLIRSGRPAVVMGEQVAGAAGYGWFDGVRSDLEGEDYASRAVDVPSCAVDAPHIRQRLYWVALANADDSGRNGRAQDTQREPLERNAIERPFVGSVADTSSAGLPHTGRPERAEDDEGTRTGLVSERKRFNGRNMADTDDERLEGQRRLLVHSAGRKNQTGQSPYADAGAGTYWSNHEWVKCHDGKARRTQPGLRLLVDGLPGRVGLWRIAGNAINPVLAAEVIKSVIETTEAWA